jgi:hypothetical protein
MDTFWQPVALTLVGALITSTLAWIGIKIAATIERQTDKDKALEGEKRAAYKKLLATVYGVIGHIAQGAQSPPNRVKGEDFFEIERDLTVYASDDVYKSFLALRTNSDATVTLRIAVDLILAVRKDLGHTKSVISDRDVLSAIVKEPDKFLKSKSA